MNHFSGQSIQTRPPWFGSLIIPVRPRLFYWLNNFILS
jgi:hypothetical protein